MSIDAQTYEVLYSAEGTGNAVHMSGYQEDED